jgi:Protein phosphatase 2C
MNPQSSARWKVVAGSATGTSHIRTGSKCQDYSRWTLAGAGVVLVCADGAGSVPRADVGARLACGSILSAAALVLDAGCRVSSLGAETVTDWYDRARRRISLDACVDGFDIRDYACTLLVAVVDGESALFAQLGDGAIVFRTGSGYQTAFWPQSGEYVNTTNFLTDSDFQRHLAVRIVDSVPDEIALFTDGLQPLALHYATKSVHAPFFEPMFAALHCEPDPDRLQTPLREFLTSKPVTDRTDDDTTLVLATRYLPSP